MSARLRSPRRRPPARGAYAPEGSTSRRPPGEGNQMVRYYGYYSNVSRGKRQKENQDGLIPCILEPSEDSKTYRKNWARLIQKIYEVDPLSCPKCQGVMRIISSKSEFLSVQLFPDHRANYPQYPYLALGSLQCSIPPSSTFLPL